MRATPQRLPVAPRGLRSRRLAAAIGLATLLAAAAPAAVAQPGGGQPAEGGQSPFRQPAAPTINISFRGGSIGDYLKVVKEAAAPTPVNVVVSDDVLRLKANPVELRGVTVETALNLLSQEGAQTLTPEPLLLRATGGQGGSAPVFTLHSYQQSMRQVRQPQQAPEPQRSVRVFSIRDLVEPDPGSPGALTIDPETLMSSIEAALSLHGESEGRDVLFHPEAGILIVRARGEELVVTTELLNEIRNDINARRKSAQRASEQLLGLERRVSEFETRRQVAAAEADFARRRLQEIEKLAASGGGTPAEAEEVRLELLRAEARLQTVEQEFQSVRRELDAHRAQAPAGDDRQSLLNEITRLRAEVAALRAELGRGEGQREGGGRPGGR